MSRRMNGEGTLRQRVDGRWELRIMTGYNQKNGKPAFRYFYSRTRKGVLQKYEVFCEDRRSGVDPSRNYTFEVYSNIWFDQHKHTISETTQQSYQYTLRRLQSYFSKDKLTEIMPMDIQSFLIKQREEGLSKSYLGSLRAMLFQIFKTAEGQNLVRKNPVSFVEKMRSKEQQPRKDAFTTEEVRLLMLQLPYEKIGFGIRLMLGTGMRTQELLALEPIHIEEDGTVIHIRQAVNLVKGSVRIGLPKTQNSYRDIPVPPNLYWVAQELRNVTTKFIFQSTKSEKPWNPSHFRNKFREAISSINGVRILSPHSCRHAYISVLQSLGVDFSTIQGLAGHSKIDMTFHYLHLQGSIQQDAVRRFSEAFPVDKEEEPRS